MNNLSELNNYGDTNLTYTDLRSAEIIFDVDTPVNQITSFTKGGQANVGIGINIIKIVLPNVIQAYFQIDVSATSGATVNWSSLPLGYSVTTIGPGVYRVSNIQSVIDWQQVKGAIIYSPTDYNQNFTYTAFIGWTDAQGQSYTKSWTVLNRISQRASLSSVFTLRSTAHYVAVRIAAALTSRFTVLATYSKAKPSGLIALRTTSTMTTIGIGIHSPAVTSTYVSTYASDGTGYLGTCFDVNSNGYIIARNGSNGTKQTTLIAPNGTKTFIGKAAWSNGANDEVGGHPHDVAINNTYVAIADPQTAPQGTVYVMSLSNPNPDQPVYSLVNPVILTPTTSTYGFFGSKMDMNSNKLLVGNVYMGTHLYSLTTGALLYTWGSGTQNGTNGVVSGTAGVAINENYAMVAGWDYYSSSPNKYRGVQVYSLTNYSLISEYGFNDTQPGIGNLCTNENYYFYWKNNNNGSSNPANWTSTIEWRDCATSTLVNSISKPNNASSNWGSNISVSGSYLVVTDNGRQALQGGGYTQGTAKVFLYEIATGNLISISTRSDQTGNDTDFGYYSKVEANGFIVSNPSLSTIYRYSFPTTY